MRSVCGSRYFPIALIERLFVCILWGLETKPPPARESLTVHSTAIGGRSKHERGRDQREVSYRQEATGSSSSGCHRSSCCHGSGVVQGRHQRKRHKVLLPNYVPGTTALFSSFFGPITISVRFVPAELCSRGPGISARRQRPLVQRRRPGTTQTSSMFHGNTSSPSPFAIRI